MDRITAIRKSLHAFVWGIIGFLPLIGVIPAFYSLHCWSAVRARYGQQWNPASAYLKAGAALALLGLLGSILVIFSIALTISSRITP